MIFLVEIQKVLDKNTPIGIKTDDVLKDAFIIGFLDGTVYNITKSQNNGVFIYSLTMRSRCIIKKLYIKPSSQGWALVQVQINSKKISPVMQRIMMYYFSQFDILKQYKDTKLPF